MASIIVPATGRILGHGKAACPRPAPGVPCHILDEVVTGSRQVCLVADDPGLGGCAACDNEAVRLVELRAEAAEMRTIFQEARSAWQTDLPGWLAGTPDPERARLRAEAGSVQDLDQLVALLRALPPS